jgi:glycosyltransferase involved in cell wall biosynthesis
MTLHRLAYVGREVPHYRVALFAELARRFEFAAYAMRFGSGVAERLKGVIQPATGWFPLGLDRYFGWLNDGQVLRAFRPEALLHEFSLRLASNHVLSARASRSHTRIVWWGHGLPRQNSLYGVGRVLRRGAIGRLARRGRVFVTYSSRGKVYMDEILEERIPVVEAPNTIDSPQLRATLQEIDKSGGRSATREMLDVPGDPQVAVLARLVPEKRIEASLEAALAAVGREGLVHVIGDGPDRETVVVCQERAGGNRVRWWGEVSDEAKLMKILVSCDALVAAGTLGLSAIHAMFAGLPVIACRNDGTGPWHAPEVEYLQEAGGVWWAPPSGGGLSELARAMLAQRNLLEKAGRANRSFAERRLTLEAQVGGIVRAVDLAMHD